MTVRYERPVSHAAYRGQKMALLSFFVALLSWGAHRFGFLSTPYYIAIAAVAALLALVGAYLALVGIAALWRRGARGGMASIKALTLSLLALVPAAVATGLFLKLPPLYDVTSDIADPPQWLKPGSADQSWMGARLPVTMAERSAQANAYRDLTGRRYDGALDRVYTAARKVAIDNGMTITEEAGAPELTAEPEQPAAKPDDGAVPDLIEKIPIPMPRPANPGPEVNALPPGDAYIQGERRTLLFGFRQDIVIRLREEAETTLVDIRVEARYGHHDLGTGADFIRDYLRALDAELLGIAGD
jgi:hypothetical protein